VHQCWAKIFGETCTNDVQSRTSPITSSHKSMMPPKSNTFATEAGKKAISGAKPTHPTTKRLVLSLQLSPVMA
jgi:hypothetical protein